MGIKRLLDVTTEVLLKKGHGIPLRKRRLFPPNRKDAYAIHTGRDSQRIPVRRRLTHQENWLQSLLAPSESNLRSVCVSEHPARSAQRDPSWNPGLPINPWGLQPPCNEFTIFKKKAFPRKMRLCIGNMINSWQS